MKNIKKHLSYIFSGILLVLILFFIGSAIPVFNYNAMTVLSGSMEPALGVGSVAVIVPQEDYQLEDIVTFTTDRNIPTTHRIIDKSTDNESVVYTTKGDANPAEDMTEVRKEDVVGKVAFGIPF